MWLSPSSSRRKPITNIIFTFAFAYRHGRLMHRLRRHRGIQKKHRFDVQQ